MKAYPSRTGAVDNNNAYGCGHAWYQSQPQPPFSCMVSRLTCVSVLETGEKAPGCFYCK